MNPNVPSTLLEFQSRFATEEACEAHLFAWRWPKGFVCPRCGHHGYSRIARRGLYQCNECKKQVSITAGTAMHKSMLPLRTWFWAVFLVGRHKKGISALQLQRDTGIRTYRAAWLLLHKIRACFDENSSEFPLRGMVEVDEAYVGRVAAGEHGGRGSSAACVVAAVERTPAGPLGSARMAVIPAATTEALATFIEREVDRHEAYVHTDGWLGYRSLKARGYRHRVHIGERNTGPKCPVLPAAHLLIANLKTWLRGRHHGVSKKYLGAYLAEFLYRFNRRADPNALFGWVARRLMSRPGRTLAQLRAG